MSPEPEQGGIVCDETPEEAAAEAARRQSSATPLEVERARRQQQHEAAQADRWHQWAERHELLDLMDTVRGRLNDLPRYEADRSRRAALVPRVAALAQDAETFGLDRTRRSRIEALARRVTATDALVGNAPAAHSLLAQIESFDGFTTLVSVENPNVAPRFRRALGWYTAPLPPDTYATCLAELDALETELLGALKVAG